MRKLVYGAVVALLTTLPGAAKADFVNGTFETGNLSGWTSIGDSSASTVLPYAGNWHARITNGGNSVSAGAIESFLGISAGSLTGLGSGSATQGSAIKQQITVNAGDTVTLRWNFLTNEATPSFFNDFSFVAIVGGSLQVLANTNYNGGSFLSGAGTGFAEQTGYKTFSYTFASAGTYFVGLGVTDVQDSLVDSALFADNVQLIQAVPVPAGIVLAGMGLVCVGGTTWIKRKKSQLA